MVYILDSRLTVPVPSGNRRKLSLFHCQASYWAIFSGVQPVLVSVSVSKHSGSPPGYGYADNWQYILFTADGTNERAYVNGVQILEESNGVFAGSGSDVFAIGRESTSDDEQFFSGSIDIVQVYNRALTTKEVQQNYNALKWRFQ